MIKCNLCEKYFETLRSKAQHELRCQNNPNRIITNQFLKAERLGLQKPKVSDDVRNKISIGNKHTIWSDERKKKHSISMTKAVINNPLSYTANNVCGRVKIISYNGINFHGQWEVEVAMWLDKLNINWIKPSLGFKYFWNNKQHLYYPDFFLPLSEAYIEVKGYETERDRRKWEQFPFKLFVLKKNEINQIKNNYLVGL